MDGFKMLVSGIMSKINSVEKKITNLIEKNQSTNKSYIDEQINNISLNFDSKADKSQLGNLPNIDEDIQEPSTVAELYKSNKTKINQISRYLGMEENPIDLEIYNDLTHYINSKDSEIKDFVGFEESIWDDAGNAIEDITLVQAINNTKDKVQEVKSEILTEFDNYYTIEQVNSYHQDLEDYVDDHVAALVNAAPETLDTLGELAAAFEENKEVVDALDASITNKQDKIADTLILVDTITGLQHKIQIQNGQLVSFPVE